MGESALKVIKIKNLLEKAPVKHPSSYKNIFNVQKENAEPFSVKYSEPKPKFVLLASPTIKQSNVYELTSRESVIWAEICLALKYVESKYLQSSHLMLTL